MNRGQHILFNSMVEAIGAKAVDAGRIEAQRLLQDVKVEQSWLPGLLAASGSFVTATAIGALLRAAIHTPSGEKVKDDHIEMIVWTQLLDLTRVLARELRSATGRDLPGFDSIIEHMREAAAASGVPVAAFEEDAK